jgi:hypothetical protein
MIAVRVILGLVLCAQALYAHDPGLSTATMTVRAERIEVALGFARKDVESMFSDRLIQVSIDTSERFRSIQPQLESLVSERIVLSLDGQPIQPVQVAAQQKDDNNIEILLCYQRTKPYACACFRRCSKPYHLVIVSSYRFTPPMDRFLVRQCFQQTIIPSRPTCRRSLCQPPLRATVIRFWSS